TTPLRSPLPHWLYRAPTGLRRRQDRQNSEAANAWSEWSCLSSSPIRVTPEAGARYCLSDGIIDPSHRAQQHSIARRHEDSETEFRADADGGKSPIRSEEPARTSSESGANLLLARSSFSFAIPGGLAEPKSAAPLRRGSPLTSRRHGLRPRRSGPRRFDAGR